MEFKKAKTETETKGEAKKPLLAIDTALNELGMLAAASATSATTRKDYLKEIKTIDYLNMLTINKRYVSNVSIGFRVRPSAPRVRYKPYQMPQKERHRTRSENNDDSTSDLAQTIVEDCISESLTEISNLKKAKSLESILAEVNDSLDIKSMNFGSHNNNNNNNNNNELQQVSDAVQKLKVADQ